jgi:predicted phage terminase large subunit-like protein
MSESKDPIGVIEAPPRHGKSRTAQLFVEWTLGRDHSAQIMTGSYNETLSQTFAKSVRNSIQELKVNDDRIVYTDIFPGTRIRDGDAAMNLWALEGARTFSYLATSPSGPATGFGCTLMIIDDIIKSKEEAYNERVLDRHWDWFTNTMLSRLEEGGKIIFIGTRWATGDLIGRALKHFRSLDYNVPEVKLKALQDDGTMLCDDILSRATYDMRVKSTDRDIVLANYQQEPIDLEGRLYSSFKTYSEPVGYHKILSYTDTADEGNDYLCAIIYGLTPMYEAYVLDVCYTQEPMEITEPRIAEMFLEHRVDVAYIESNNGGRGFARAVEDRMQRIGWNGTKVVWFHQSNNKDARILSNSTWVMDHVYYPNNWMDRWPDYAESMVRYQREGKNKNDDAEDATTGIAEIVKTIMQPPKQHAVTVRPHPHYA